jgi:anaerobic nitric oxide reductase transcription regulator
MNEISALALVELATDLTASLGALERYDRLLDTVRKTISCEAVALLSFHAGVHGSDQMENGLLKPIAMQGLSRDTLGRRFLFKDHPRFARICSSLSVVRFAANCELPDPYDGLLVDREGDLPVHACMGLPLYFDDALLGVLTLDSFTAGAFDDIPKRTLEVISSIAAATLNTALMIEQLEAQAKHSQQVVNELAARYRDDAELVGDSPVMNRLKREISIAAPSDFTVLICGETGVGKELVARAIHSQSMLSKGPLVYVNCAALAENLIESELFGHVKGAFTGAHSNRLGKFAMADGGTLFLDEIGELPLGAQSKLLRALQNKEIQPVGQDAVQTVNVRVIAATNRNLLKEVEQDKFRADLYHRLSVYPIEVPSLRSRIGDASLLAGFFIERIRRKLGLKQLKMSSKVARAMDGYDWPGNVRELQHVINRSALKARAHSDRSSMVVIELWHCSELNTEQVKVMTGTQGSVGPSAMGEYKGESVEGNFAISGVVYNKPLREATEQFQREMIVRAIEDNGGNWAKAAKQLGVDRGNLSRLGKRLGVSVLKKLIF